MLFGILGKKNSSKEAKHLYNTALDQSRLEVFYSEYGVPDSVDGRFEMIALHVFLILHRLKQKDINNNDLSQELFDHMFKDLDQALREMGIGDLSVGRKVKSMAKAFYGRVAAFEASLHDEKELNEAIFRNVYRGQKGNAQNSLKLAKYLEKQVAHLSDLKNAELTTTTNLFKN